MWVRPSVVGFVCAFGCADPVVDDEYEACSNLCDEMVRECSYDAYPTTESCMAGCADDIEAEAALFELEVCILEADCDTFAIIECQNHFGSGE